jgi:membrane fusion protein (multidrug efflux system)
MKNNFLQRIPLSKRMRVMLFAVGILFGLIIIYKLFIHFIISYSISHMKNVVPVSAMTVDYSTWQPAITVSGSVRAVKGVNVTTESAGMVKAIYFKPGSEVQEGTTLVLLNADAEMGQLQSLKAQAVLAEMTLKRDTKQYAVRAISKQTLDNDVQNLKNLQGQVMSQQGIVDKKIIRAPFSGRLGINRINLGQYLNVGDVIVSLQTNDPIWVDFYIPQQSLAKIKMNGTVSVTTGSYPNQLFKGKITTINPSIDVDSRNVEVEATIANPKQQLSPGMFVTVSIDVDAPKQYLTLPQSAISYNPYGDLVYVVQSQGNDKHDKSNLLAMQTFVETGQVRGDQVAILKGLKQGDVIVTSGMLKLKNRSPIEINNAITLPNLPVVHLNNEPKD